MPSTQRLTKKQGTQKRSSAVQQPQPAPTRQTARPEGALERVRQGPQAVSAAELLQLQRAVGNQAVGRLVGELARVPEEAEEEQAEAVALDRTPVGTTAPKATVQRKSTSGLAGSKLTKGFAGGAYAFWKDETNKDKPLRALTDHLVAEVNKLLPWPCTLLYPAGMNASTRGSFDRTAWVIRMNTTAFSSRAGVTKVGQLNREEVSGIVNTVYHEARHSEQYWQIARLQAGTGKDALDIMKDMSIPLIVALLASLDPLKGDTKANKKLVAEAKEWEQITVGKYGAYKGQVYGVMDDGDAMLAALNAGTLEARMTNVRPKIIDARDRVNTFFTPQETTITAIAKKDRDKFDKNVLKRVRRIKKRFQKVLDEYNRQIGPPAKYALNKLWKIVLAFRKAGYQAYRAFEHEKDTWAVGGAAARRFKKKSK